MKAVTIQQPWAHLVIHGYFDAQIGTVRRKDVENRVWPSGHRGPLAIHAGKGLGYVKTTPPEWPEDIRVREMPRSSAVASEGRKPYPGQTSFLD